MKKKIVRMYHGKISGLTATNLALGASAALALFLAAPAAAQPAPADCTGRQETGTWINLEVENVRSSSGTITITAYPDNSKTFLKKDGEVSVGRVQAQQGTTKGCIFVPGTGVYALALYHDENANRKFDRNPLPKEGYGFSNNPSTFLGLPAFKSVRTSIPAAGTNVQVRMKYP